MTPRITILVVILISGLVVLWVCGAKFGWKDTGKAIFDIVVPVTSLAVFVYLVWVIDSNRWVFW